MPAYRVTIDKEACEGIFACLTRDPRFVEDNDDGLATIDPDADPVYDGDGSVWSGAAADTIVAEFDDDRADEARQAAEACPPGAISVQQLPDEPPADGGHPATNAADPATEGGDPDA